MDSGNLISGFYNTSLTVKALITTAADNILFSLFKLFTRKWLGISCESSALADDSHEMQSIIFSEK